MTAKDSIRIVLADNQSLLRVAVRTILADAEKIEVVADASDGHEALSLVEAHHPNILMTGITLRGMNGLELAARVVKEFPQVRIIVLSKHAAPEYVWQALQSGVAAYLLKDAEPSEIQFAIRAVARGNSYLTPHICKHLIATCLKHGDFPTSPLEMLSPRQRETLQLIAQGHTTKEIARLMHVNVKTAETFRLQIMERLDIHDIAGLVRFAIRVGLVSPEQ